VLIAFEENGTEQNQVALFDRLLSKQRARFSRYTASRPIRALRGCENLKGNRKPVGFAKAYLSG
jgi:hypothetical protein